MSNSASALINRPIASAMPCNAFPYEFCCVSGEFADEDRRAPDRCGKAAKNIKQLPDAVHEIGRGREMTAV